MNEDVIHPRPVAVLIDGVRCRVIFDGVYILNVYNPILPRILEKMYEELYIR